jgi:hypothetical protein
VFVHVHLQLSLDGAGRLREQLRTLMIGVGGLFLWLFALLQLVDETDRIVQRPYRVQPRAACMLCPAWSALGQKLSPMLSHAVRPVMLRLMFLFCPYVLILPHSSIGIC